MDEKGKEKNKNLPTALLDISLFVLDSLDPDRIVKDSMEQRVKFEVPGALATMIAAAKEGDKTLYQLVYGYLLGIKNNKIHQEHQDPRVKYLLHANEKELSEKANISVDRIIATYSSLIWEDFSEDADSSKDRTHNSYNKKKRGFQEQSKQNSLEKQTASNLVYVEKKKHIHRYEPFISLPMEKMIVLRHSYSKYLTLPEHPLFDLYFLQVYHAQKSSNYYWSESQHWLVSIGWETHKILSSISNLVWEFSVENVSWPHTNDTDYLHEYIDYLEWFTNTYIRQEFRNILIDLGLTITLSCIVSGGPQIGLALIGLVGLIPKSTYEAPKGRFSRRTLNVIRVTGFLSFVCIAFLIAIFIEKPEYLFPKPTPTSRMLATPSPENVSLANTLVVDTTNTPQSQAMQATPTFPLLLSYCNYVTQPGDTPQLIADWFQISETDVRTGFDIHQALLIPVSCCHPWGDQGFSYLVTKGETLYSISRKYNMTANALALFNNLHDPWYIQAGQMLCIPYP